MNTFGVIERSPALIAAAPGSGCGADQWAGYFPWPPQRVPRGEWLVVLAGGPRSAVLVDPTIVWLVSKLTTTSTSDASFALPRARSRRSASPVEKAAGRKASRRIDSTTFAVVSSGGAV